MALSSNNLGPPPGPSANASLTPTPRKPRSPALSSGLREVQLLPEAAHATREPYSVKRWLSYVRAVDDANLPACDAFLVYEQAVAALPGSYKLWRQYAQRARELGVRFPPAHAARAHSVTIARRAASALRAAPRLWEDVIELCAGEGLLREARSALDAALQALPPSQHDRIWELVVRELVPLEGPLSAVALLTRYSMLRPAHGALRLFEYRKAKSMWDDAVAGMVRCLENSTWEPPEGKTREELWVEAAELASKHPREVVSVDVPGFLRKGLADAKDSDGLRIVDLYQLLTRYYVRGGDFDQARAVYEEAVSVIKTVHDFAVLYDAYTKFEEQLVTAALEEVEEIRAEGDEADKEELKEAEKALEVLMSRLEQLEDRRPMLLSDVWLRQNPHNVQEWHKRARLFKKAGDPAAVVQTYTTALATVEPMRASNGRPHTLWLAFASYYEDAQDADSARKVLDKAVSEPEKFAQPQDLAAVWCEYAEMELRLEEPTRALKVLQLATVQPEGDRARTLQRENGVGSHAKKSGVVHYDHLEKGRALSAWKSNKLWSFLLDVTESFEPSKSVIALYHRMLDLGIATAENVLNATTYLESHHLFEQAFRLYDRGASSLQWPAALTVWVVYLTRFANRHGQQKMERLRSLFEEAVRAAPSYREYGRDVPSEHLPLLFRMWADAEERAHAPRRAMAVLARAARSVASADRAGMYRLYIARMGTLFGVTRTRPIFEEALAELQYAEEVMEFARRFADAETQLGEIDRARAIFKHAARVADARAPEQTPAGRYWKAWSDFELAHGSEDAFRDMLRVKRDVLMRTPGAIVPEPAVGTEAGGTAAANGGAGEAADDDLGGAMAALERRLEAEVDGTEEKSVDENGANVAEGVADAGNEEIELDLDSDDDESDEGDGDDGEDSEDDGIEIVSTKKELPKGVKKLLSRATEIVGEKRKEVDEGSSETGPHEGVGALERFKRLKQ